MDWEPYGDKASRIKAIADAAKGADRLILATDPDREGEAISWHVRELLAKRKALPKEVERVTFNAITKATVTEAMKHPRELDQDLIDAYLARRALDYLFGFTLSPVLWRKLPGAKSAGRVQSVALRLICEREHEIEVFKPQEYWSVVARLEQGGTEFAARLVRFEGEKLERLSIGEEGTALRAKAAVEAGAFKVEEVETKPTRRNPYPPFTTSTIQQEAARKLGFSASHTMRVAQNLYEAGAITYMRTDGVQMDPSAISDARRAISDRYSGHYLPEKPRRLRNQGQERAGSARGDPAGRLCQGPLRQRRRGAALRPVWKRALASQMASARSSAPASPCATAPAGTSCAPPGRWSSSPASSRSTRKAATRRRTAGTTRTAACCRSWPRAMPRPRRASTPASISPSRRRAIRKPSLVKRLEELGIGRPSTYASTLQVLKDRNYVRTEKNRFFAEESGRLLTAFLERFFPRYVGYDFTAGHGGRARRGLGRPGGVEGGARSVLEGLQAQERRSDGTQALGSDRGAGRIPLRLPVSPARGWHRPAAVPQVRPEGRGAGRLALRGGRFGAFVACSNYPECKFTRKFAQPGGNGAEAADAEVGKHPETGEAITRSAGRFGPYIQLGEGKEAKRASIPKDIPELDLDWAVRLLSLPRTIGPHPETRRADHRQHRPLRALSRPQRQVRQAARDRRGVRHRHERGGGEAGRCGQRRRAGRTHGRRAAQDVRAPSDLGRRDEADGGALWALRDGRHDQRHPAARQGSPRR